MRKFTFGQILVLAFAIISAMAFITGVHGWQRDGTLLRYHGSQRLIALVAAIFCFAWFVGLRRRSVWAWYIGCALFVLSIVQIFAVQGVFTFIQQRATLFGWWALISQTLLALIVFFLLTRWWIPKKHEFHSPGRA